ncbi:MAG TPA: hypothetical protein VN894_20630, partial [Polyangiaceae bacterium]|nr:hypothetical protein [Polyangiaceae bacterium]
MNGTRGFELLAGGARRAGPGATAARSFGGGGGSGNGAPAAADVAEAGPGVDELTFTVVRRG